MPEGQKDGSGAMTDLEDEKVRKEDILSNREESQRPPGQSLDSRGVQVAEYKDVPTNRRPRAAKDQQARSQPDQDEDRPGFDLGGSSGNTQAGQGLGLDKDAKEDREGLALPREEK